MDSIPRRPRVSSGYRAVLTYLEQHLPLPRINPSWWSLAGLVASIACLYVPHRPGATFVLVAFAVVTDWLDGATARESEAVSREGYLTDNVVDRFSEGFIFAAGAGGTPVMQVFFVLWLVNCGLTIWSVASHQHRILPLRAAYLVALLVLILL